MNHKFCLHAVEHVCETFGAIAAFRCTDPVNLQIFHFPKNFICGLEIHGYWRKFFMKLIASRVVINTSFKIDFFHDLIDSNGIEDNILIGKGVFVNGIAG